MGEQRRGLTALATGVLALGTAAAALAADPAVICETGKMIRAGTYELCVLKATTLALKQGAAAPDLSRCDAKFDSAWAKIEATGGSLCPTSGDASAIAAQVRSDANAIVASLMPPVTPTPCGGGIYPGCGGACAAGLTCWAQVSAGPTQSCACLASVATPCADTGGSVLAGPTCGGACPAGGVCTTLAIDDSTLSATCGCVPAGSTPCISSSQPTCGGTCPPGLACGADPLGLFSCVCQ
jgi:hypothetical protein